MPVDLDVLNKDIPSILRRLNVSSDQRNSSRLSGSIGSQKGEHFSSFDSECQILYRSDVTERFGQV
jgi:hypothetical protein